MVSGSAGGAAQSTRKEHAPFNFGIIGHERPAPGDASSGGKPSIPDAHVFDEEWFAPDAPPSASAPDEACFGKAITDEQLLEEKDFDEQPFDDAFFDESLHDFLDGDPLTIARALTELGPEAIRGFSPEKAVETLAAAARLEGWLAAFKARVVHRVEESLMAGSGTVRRQRFAAMNAVSETACVLRIPEGVAGYLINESAALVQDFPRTLSALEKGRIHYQHAQTIVREGSGLPVGSRSGFEEKLLVVAPDLTKVQLATRARRLRECAHPEAQADRRRKAELDRRVYVEPAGDGMAYLGAFLPAESALALFNRVSAVARSLQGTRESRTLGQLRADVLTDLVLGSETPERKGRTHPRRIKAQVLVTVPVLSLLGHSDASADLEGYGPIPATVARQLAAHAPSMLRVLTDPVDGGVLSVGRRRYRIPKDLQIYVRACDRTCRFPGCNRSASRADLDHTVSWEDGGSTSHDNLAALCRKHHRMKHEAGWSVRHRRGRVLEWSSPAGRSYTTEPERPPSSWGDALDVPPF